MRVVKVGGSLLDWPAFAPRLKQWFAEQPPAPTLFVVGGGRLVDVIRDAQQAHGLTDDAAHWLCIEAMHLNAVLLSEIMLGLPIIDNPVSPISTSESCVLDPRRWLRGMSANQVPRDWTVTSDSIAALCAKRTLANELILLKSALPDPGATINSAAAASYVDEFFPIAAEGLKRVVCVNLRAISAASELR